MAVIMPANQKGGVGKTTTALNLGVELANKGARVLLIDLDPQANLTRGLMGMNFVSKYSSYELLKNPEEGASYATVATKWGVDLIPSGIRLAGAEIQLMQMPARENLLKRALKKTRNEYDFVFIDPAPTLGQLFVNGLVAADTIFIPLQISVYAWDGLPKLEQTIAGLKEVELISNLDVGGVIITMTDRTKLSKEIEALARERYGAKVFNTLIPRSVKLVESPGASEPIRVYDEGGAAALAYASLAQEVINRYGNK